MRNETKAAYRFLSALSLLVIILRLYPLSAIEVMSPRTASAKSLKGIGELRVEGQFRTGTATYTRDGHLITAAHNIPRDSAKVFFRYSLDGGRTLKEIEIDPVQFRVPDEYFEIIDSDLSQQEKIARSNPFDFAIAKLDPLPESEVMSPFKHSSDLFVLQHSRIWEVYGNSSGFVAGTRNLGDHSLHSMTSGHKIIFVPEASNIYFFPGDSGGPLLIDNVDGTYEITGVIVAREVKSGGFIAFFDQEIKRFILGETPSLVGQRINPSCHSLVSSP